MDQKPSLIQTFLDKVEDVLLESAYINAFLGSSDIVDICAIDIDEKQTGQRWIQQLLNSADAEVEISATPSKVDKLRQIYFEAKNIERFKGYRSLGFGYPMLIVPNKDNPFLPKAVPLFIWSVNLIPSPNRLDNWHLKHRADKVVKLNPFLASQFPKLFPESRIEAFQKAIHKFKQDQSFDPLLELLVQLGEEAQLDYVPPEERIASVPSPSQALLLAEKRSIFWSGVLAIFPVQPFKLISYYQNQLVELSDKPFTELEKHLSSSKKNNAGHPFGFYVNDNQQERVFRSARSHEITFVSGASGSGKKHTLANIISNALSNNEKCLILSEEVQVLKDIFSMLTDMRLSLLLFLLQDINYDKVLFLEKLRRAVENQKRPGEFNQESFDLILSRCLRNFQKLDTAFNAVNGNIFGTYSWTETVGKFLKSNKIEGKELLGSQLNPSDFVFTFSEYEMLKEAITKSKPLYEKINTLKHPLSDLHPSIFSAYSQTEAHAHIIEKLDEFKRNTTFLQHRYIRKLDAYSEKLTRHYEDHYNELWQILTNIKENIEDFKNKYGPDFIESGVVTNSKLHFYGVFSNKHKNILQAKDQIGQEFSELHKHYSERQYFDYRFPPSSEGKNIKRIVQTLEDFEKTLQHWYQKLPLIIQEEVHRLSSKTVHVDLDYYEQIKELEYALDLLVEEINNSNLFNQPLQNNMLTIPKRQQFVEEIIEKIELTHFNLRDFEDYYHWQKNWLSLGEISQKLIRALAKVKPKNWLAAFESWYFHNRLTLDYQSSLPSDDQLLETFVETYNLLRQELPNQIVDNYLKEFTISSRALKRQRKDQYAMLFGKNNLKTAQNVSLEEIISTNIESITDTIPAFLTTPSIATQVFLNGETSPIFDYLLIDEASELSLESIYPLLDIAKHTIAFGEHELPGEHPQKLNLQDYFQQLGGKTLELNHLHLKVPNHLQTLYQAAFSPKYPEGTLKTINFSSDELKLFKNENRYDEESSTNEEEANLIIKALNEIKLTKHKTFPSVTIACFTQEQRNLIADSILKIKQRRSPGSERIRQLERNGLIIVHVDELHGYKSDILMLSTTFGSVNLKGDLSPDIFWLNTHEGYKAMRSVLSCTTQELWIFTALSEKHIDALYSNWNKFGTALLAAIIKYAQAVEDKDQELPFAILEQIIQTRKPQKYYTKNSLFIEEVAEALKPYLGEGRVSTEESFGDLKLPLVISSNHVNNPPLVVIADGFFFKNGPGAFLWEDEIRKTLKKAGYQIYTTWSSNWWKNPTQEARKIASIIIKQDSLYKPVSKEA